MDFAKLEQRITRLEDLEAIKQLKARYCEICDDNHDAERITSIFTEDAVWEGRGIGKAKGHAEIRALLTDVMTGNDGDRRFVISRSGVLFSPSAPFNSLLLNIYFLIFIFHKTTISRLGTT